MILGVSFYAVATLLINLVGGYLFQTKVTSETAVARGIATELAPYFELGDSEQLYQIAEQHARDLDGRLLVVDMDGKVQMDTSSALNGWRLGHPEVVSVLGDALSDNGFHLIRQTGERENIALFDFLRNPQNGMKWVGYFTERLSASTGENLGLVLFSVSVQDMVDQLRKIQDEMLLYFALASIAVLIMSLVFTRVITNPIAALTEGIKRMGRGDLSGRVQVTGGDEIARLGETFNQMSEKLENLDTSRNEFVSNASHELKTPLATMKILLESMLYQDDMDPALRQEFLGDINKELDRLSNIVTDLLTLVQSDAQEYKPTFKEVSLRELVEDTMHRLEPLAQEKEQTLLLDAQAAAPVWADVTRMQQVIYNLVDNAIKYSPSGGHVEVSVRQEGKLAVLEVADDGPGIPKKDQTHIFDRFYRVDRARARATGGNGLGLSIVHQAVLMHDGSVTVQSEEGHGSTFRVELPLYVRGKEVQAK